MPKYLTKILSKLLYTPYINNYLQSLFLNLYFKDSFELTQLQEGKDVIRKYMLAHLRCTRNKDDAMEDIGQLQMYHKFQLYSSLILLLTILLGQKKRL